MGYLDGGLARFGRSYIAEPDAIAKEVGADPRRPRGRHAVLRVPNQLGVEDNAATAQDDRRPRCANDGLARARKPLAVARPCVERDLAACQRPVP